MHVLYDARLLHRPLSGIERVQRNVVRELADQEGIDRLGIVVLEGTKLPPDLPKNVEVHGVIGTEDILAILLSSDAPDVYHLSWFPDRHPRDLLLPMVARASVVEVHDAILNRHPEYHHSRDSWSWYDGFVRHLVANADRLLVHSKSVADEVTGDLGGDAGRIDLAPLAVDPGLRGPLAAAEVKSRLDKLGITELGDYFFALGKDYPHKDHATFFRALARLDGTTNIVCAGSKVWHAGKDTDRLLQKLKIENRVHWVQDLSDTDVKALLQGSRGLVYPSLEEGFGLPPIEAMALGVPVVAAASMSIPEVCGDAALLFEPGNDEELLARLRTLLAGGPTIEGLVERGKKREADFTWRRCAEDTAACYRRALASGRPRLAADPVRAAIRIMAGSPFCSERELNVWQGRYKGLEEHVYAVEANRDEILRQLHELQRQQGQPVTQPQPTPSPGPQLNPQPNGKPGPRWSLRRRLRKIRDGIRKRLGN